MSQASSWIPNAAPCDACAGVAKTSASAAKTAAPTPRNIAGNVAAPRLCSRFDRHDVLAAAEVDRAHDMRPSVQRNFLADVRETVEHQPSGGDEIAVLVRAIHTGDRPRRQQSGTLCCMTRPWRRRMPGGTLAGQRVFVRRHPLETSLERRGPRYPV